MKKLLIGAVSAVALTLAFSGPAAAVPGASQYCTANGDFGLSHGDCVSLIENLYNKGNAEEVGVCKLFKEFYPGIFDYYFKNLGDCVSSLRHA